jgi:vancomycin resistance protein YoaR
MKKYLSFRIHPLLVAAIVAAVFFAALGAAYALTRKLSNEEVMGRVEVAGTAIGGLSREQAISAILGVEDQYLARTASFAIDGNEVSIEPPEAGFDVDEEAIVEQALQIGREGNGAFQFLWWLQHIFSTEEVDLVGSTEPQALDDLFDAWDSEVIAMPASLGAIELNGSVPRAIYPQEGLGIDRKASARIIEASLLAEEPVREELPTSVITPQLTDADIDQALLEASNLLAEPIRMVFNGNELIFTPEQLVEAYRSETIAVGSPQIVHYFDPAVIDRYLNPVREQYEAEPVNAEFEISGDAIVVIPGSRGTRIDEEETAAKLIQAGRTNSRLDQLPLIEDADPEVTTEYLEGLGIKHLVSSFTTFHSCCENRVVNIQTMADTIDEHIMLPGEEFSINGFVGQRTPEKGYLPAGTIVAGELKDTVGGGVSQFATTIYNAVFWGGYEDVDHKPHSYYFSRYPEGIEATVNWQTPNMIFRNNTDKAIMIDTQHTGNSITVRIFGDNDGRTVKGEQTGGATHLNVTAEGGPDALHVEGEVSDRFAQRGPGGPRLVANPAITDPDKRIKTQSERDGWSVNVTRRILRGGIQLVEEQEWLVTYLPQFAVFEVHPCMTDGDAGDCPQPTTTTVVTTTPTTTVVTTTTIPSSTTTAP